MSEQKGGWSEERTDIFGNKYVQYYDKDGNKISWSEEREGLLGDQYTQHHEQTGQKAGWSQEREGLLGDEYTQHYDRDGNKAGWSEEREGLLGDEYTQHYDRDGNKAGWSEDRKGLLGDEYTQYHEQKPFSPAGSFGVGYRVGEKAAPLFVILLVICAVIFVFLLPAILVIWMSTGDMGRSTEIALRSAEAWIGSGVFWIVLVLVVVKRKALVGMLSQLLSKSCHRENQQTESTAQDVNEPTSFWALEASLWSQEPKVEFREDFAVRQQQSESQVIPEPKMFRFLCPNCNKKLKALRNSPGRNTRCPRCGMALRVSEESQN